jgi:hypothetical protein
MQRHRLSDTADGDETRDESPEAAHAAAFPEHRRAIGFYVTTSEDVAYLWREAKQYMDKAERQSDPKAAERFAHLGCEFAVMAVALLSELSEAAADLDAYVQPRRAVGAAN